MHFGFIHDYDDKTGIGHITSATAPDPEPVLFHVDVNKVEFKVGKRVTYDEGKRAINVVPNDEELGVRVR